MSAAIGTQAPSVSLRLLHNKIPELKRTYMAFIVKEESSGSLVLIYELQLLLCPHCTASVGLCGGLSQRFKTTGVSFY